MKAKWILYILWSVFSLDVANSKTDRLMYESPTVSRPVARRKVLKLGSSEYIGRTDDLSSTDNRKSALTLPSHSVPFSLPQIIHDLKPGPAKQFSSTPSQNQRLVRPERPELSVGGDYFYSSDVTVTCSTSEFVVRVKRAFYGFGVDAEELTLGDTCKNNGVLRPYGDLLFTYRLTECNGKREMLPGYLNYKFVLHYVPSPTRFPRAHRVNLDIECWFPRHQHVYTLAVRPTWKTPTVRKILNGRSNDFRIQLMDDAWTMPVKSPVYLLGHAVNFQVSALHLPHGGKLFISTCYASTSDGSNPSTTYTIIDNFGCMLESHSNPGVSGFVSPRTDDTIRFSISAFQLTSDPDSQVNIHCKLFVTSGELGPLRKSCTYREKRWRALNGPDSICKCCDSECVASKPRRAMLEGSASSGPLLVSDQPFAPEVDGRHPPRPSPLCVSDDDGQDDIRFESGTNGRTDELLALEEPPEGFDVEKGGDGETQSYTPPEEDGHREGGEEDTPGGEVEAEVEELGDGRGEMIEGEQGSGVMSESIRGLDSGFRDLEGSPRREGGEGSEEEDTVLRKRSESEEEDTVLRKRSESEEEDTVLRKRSESEEEEEDTVLRKRSEEEEEEDTVLRKRSESEEEDRVLRERSGSEREGSELEEEEGSGEGAHLQEKEKSSLGSGKGEETVPLEGGVSQSKMERRFGMGKGQSLEAHSEKEEGEEEGRDGPVSGGEDHQKAPFSETVEEELLLDYDGLVETGVEGGRDLVWRFKWR